MKGVQDALHGWKEKYMEEAKAHDALKEVHSHCRPPVERQAFTLGDIDDQATDGAGSSATKRRGSRRLSSVGRSPIGRRRTGSVASTSTSARRRATRCCPTRLFFSTRSPTPTSLASVAIRRTATRPRCCPCSGSTSGSSSSRATPRPARGRRRRRDTRAQVLAGRRPRETA